MALLKFFKVPKHQQFQYKTRYWDPKKEELEERLRVAEERKNDSVEASKARISSSFRRKGHYSYGNSDFRRREARSNLVLLGIVIVLIALSYMFLVVYLPRIVQMVEGGGGM